ncbi:aldehyde dehydrogenase family protein [Nocardia sp. NPDC020380]|uniref:aldehyde dehydrogenase family protein n=1 Tax=Nocardia sp. NPDC020380 TaxID=3364309 RepID=UPI0037B56B74
MGRWRVRRPRPGCDEFFAGSEVRAINLIGGVNTARVLAERAGRTLKRTVLELGGHNPMLILDDVDVDYAVRTATFGSFFHQGQICLNTRKIIIQRGIYEEFLDKFIAPHRNTPIRRPAGSAHDHRPAHPPGRSRLDGQANRRSSVTGRDNPDGRDTRRSGVQTDHPDRRALRGRGLQ